MAVHIDFETRGEVDLAVVGLWNYATHPSTEVIMASWAVGDEPVKQWDASQGPIPEELLDILRDPFTMMTAWNSAFERVITMFVLGIPTEIGRWVDPMIQARYMSLPGSLEKVSQILDLKEGKMDTLLYIKNQYMVEFFCAPIKRKGKDAGRYIGGWVSLFGVEPASYRDWNTHPKEWALFCKYNRQDVEAERAAENRMKKFQLPEFEYALYELDQQINDRGAYTDSVLIQGATIIVEKERAALTAKLKEKTGISNPNSTPQLMAWLRPKGYHFASLGKPWVKRALAGECELDADATEVLNLRLQLSKSGVSKLEALRNQVAADGRVRHMLSFMGAGRTHRWCLGEGSLIKVKIEGRIKEIPIEAVTTEHLVWDGEEWVEHGGVVFSGDKDVIEWEGVVATPEHEVWVSEEKKVPLQEAKDKELGLWKGKGV